MKTQPEGEFVSIAGKVSAWCYGRLKRILAKKGITTYQMVQNAADSFVRHMDDKHNLTPESEKLMSVFEHMEGWKDNFNLADPATNPEICEATYYITAKDKKNVRVMHVERPFFADWKQNFNIQQILERFLCLTFPQLYRRLRFMAVCRECASIFELLVEVVCELEEEEKKKELREDFEDAERMDYGKRPSRTPYRRRHQQTMSLFDNEDLPDNMRIIKQDDKDNDN